MIKGKLKKQGGSKMQEIYNFSAGPAVMPKPVLKQIQNEMMSYRGSGQSVLEMSHRSSLFQEIIKKAEETLRALMQIPDEYDVLFLQGGASLQFTMVPLNLGIKKAGYIHTGIWAEKAIQEAEKMADLEVAILASSAAKNFTYIPEITSVPQDLDYVHLTTNNTIEGTAFYALPKTGEVPLIGDFSSNILSFDYDVKDFGLIYAGAQKNMGPAGLTIVIVRKDLLGKKKGLPAMLDYKLQAENGSMYNTPPTFAIYAAGLVFDWLKEQGGIKEMEQRSRQKAQLLYETLDASSLFYSSVTKKDRSLMTIPFMTGKPDLDDQFIKEAEKVGLVNLKGHRSVGGMRASLYNAFPLTGVETLTAFMQDFEQQNGGNRDV